MKINFPKPNINLPVLAYDVQIVSPEYLEIIELMPEAVQCGSVQLDGQRIQGPKTIIRTTSLEEIEKKLPHLLKQIPEIKTHTVFLTEKRGHCQECQQKNIPCEHPFAMASMNRSIQIDTTPFQ